MLQRNRPRPVRDGRDLDGDLMGGKEETPPDGDAHECLELGVFLVGGLDLSRDNDNVLIRHGYTPTVSSSIGSALALTVMV